MLLANFSCGEKWEKGSFGGSKSLSKNFFFKKSYQMTFTFPAIEY